MLIEFVLAYLRIRCRIASESKGAFRLRDDFEDFDFDRLYKIMCCEYIWSEILYLGIEVIVRHLWFRLSNDNDKLYLLFLVLELILGSFEAIQLGYCLRVYCCFHRLGMNSCLLSFIAIWINDLSLTFILYVNLF